MDITGKLVFRDPKLIIKDVAIKGVPVRVYQPKAPQSLRRGIIHIHGGATVAGSIGITLIGYSLSPEHSYPLQFQQCLDVTVHLLEHAEDYEVDPARVIVCGDSFGGLLTAVTCQVVGQRRDLPKPRAQILLYPLLQMVKFNLPSYLQNGRTPILFKRQVLRFGLQYLKRDISITDLILEGAHVSEDMKMKYKKWLSVENIPEEFRKREAKVVTPAPPFRDIYEGFELAASPKLSPLFAEDEVIRQLPETLILTCQYDVLRDEGILYKKRLEENGVPVSWCHLVDGFHAALFLVNNVFFHFPCTKTGMDHVVNFIRGL
ncbi:PREDICTED: arylacetamide deacetylase-like 3 [Gekko japonicus]|uniref:Arylacetamide deacetylase-like 3 n=1 Tax=Gekko japonicus TaxID=146911 RepID=A0ABM1JSA4_GEKJA|nr:PREDICTED: arylacetamide deacetylase-like 3 [Gekko japonicus]